MIPCISYLFSLLSLFLVADALFLDGLCFLSLPFLTAPPIRPLRLPGCSGVVSGHQKPGTGQEKAEKSHVCHGGIPQLLRLQPIVSIGPDVSISI